MNEIMHNWRSEEIVLKIDLNKAKRALRIKEAREDFWTFCKTMNPEFFRDDREYQKIVANSLQGIYEGTIINEVTGQPYKKMLLNLPPSHGKTYTVEIFDVWLLGKNMKNRILCASYTMKLALRISVGVRDMLENRYDIVDKELDICLADIFPDLELKKGDAGQETWNVKGAYSSFKVGSSTATITGFRGDICIIDDPISGFEEAINAEALEKKWNWYVGTWKSRVADNGIEIVIQTRWASKDISGMLLENEPDDWYEVKMKACIDESKGIMLCESIKKFKDYISQKALQSTQVLLSIFMANYQQEPIDVQGLLYGEGFKEYEIKPEKFTKTVCYIDVADTGKDSLCAIVAGEYEGYRYILDVLYTDEPAISTTPQVADLLVKWKPSVTRIEKNSMGNIFADNVVKDVWERHRTRDIKIERFHQKDNKIARIHGKSGTVMNTVMFPANWKSHWRKFAQDLMSYQAKGKNKHDDAPDALTGLVEMLDKPTSRNRVSAIGFR